MLVHTVILAALAIVSIGLLTGLLVWIRRSEGRHKAGYIWLLIGAYLIWLLFIVKCDSDSIKILLGFLASTVIVFSWGSAIYNDAVIAHSYMMSIVRAYPQKKHEAELFVRHAQNELCERSPWLYVLMLASYGFTWLLSRYAVLMPITTLCLLALCLYLTSKDWGEALWFHYIFLGLAIGLNARALWISRPMYYELNWWLSVGWRTALAAPIVWLLAMIHAGIARQIFNRRTDRTLNWCWIAEEINCWTGLACTIAWFLAAATFYTLKLAG